MKKLIAIICVSMCMLTAQSLAVNYYCGSTEVFSINNVYDVTNSCEAWNTDFWKENSPNAYKNCVENKKVLKQKYDAGKCKPMITKTHAFGSGECTVELLPGTNRVVSTSCHNTPAGSMEKVKAMYNR